MISTARNRRSLIPRPPARLSGLSNKDFPSPDRLNTAGWRKNTLLSIWVTVILVASSMSNAAAKRPNSKHSGSKRSADTASQNASQVGPLQIDPNRRRIVRGDRPERASIYAKFAPPIHEPDRDLREQLRIDDKKNNEELKPSKNSKPHTNRPPYEPPQWLNSWKMPDISFRWHPRIVHYIEYFRNQARGQAIFRSWMQRMGRYQSRVESILIENRLPKSLAFVALVESGFHPGRYSRVGAAGLWQFMKPTAAVYGLQIEYWRDDRLDIERSTYAAAAYLSDLHARFGNWELALAAYNAGYGLILTTLRRNNTNNFWALRRIENGLPLATANYVPKILALAILGQNLDKLGFKLNPDQPVDLVQVKVGPRISIRSVAEKIGVDADDLTEYNQAWLRGRTSPRYKSNILWIPSSAKSSFEAVADQFQRRSKRLKKHSILLGEDLPTIAKRYHISPDDLREFNAIHDSAELVAGTILLVPNEAERAKATSKTELPTVAFPPLQLPANKEVVYLRTNRSFTLAEICRAFSIPWSKIVEWNDIDPSARLMNGQYLQLFVDSDFRPEDHGLYVYRPDDVQRVDRGSLQHIDALAKARDLARRGYRVRRGDTLVKIARRFRMTVGSLARVNGVTRRHRPKKGDVVIVYVPQKRTRGTISAPRPRPGIDKTSNN